MRTAITFIAVMAIGALVATILGGWTDGFGPGFAAGVGYMIVASLVLNSCSTRRV